eukprot:188944-Chlamydomonas_euryale.AAC.4
MQSAPSAFSAVPSPSIQRPRGLHIRGAERDARENGSACGRRGGDSRHCTAANHGITARSGTPRQVLDAPRPRPQQKRPSPPSAGGARRRQLRRRQQGITAQRRPRALRNALEGRRGRRPGSSPVQCRPRLRPEHNSDPSPLF